MLHGSTSLPPWAGVGLQHFNAFNNLTSLRNSDSGLGADKARQFLHVGRRQAEPLRRRLTRLIPMSGVRLGVEKITGLIQPYPACASGIFLTAEANAFATPERQNLPDTGVDSRWLLGRHPHRLYMVALEELSVIKDHDDLGFALDE